MILKCVSQRKGGHVHTRYFAAERDGVTMRVWSAGVHNVTVASGQCPTPDEAKSAADLRAYTAGTVQR